MCVSIVRPGRTDFCGQRHVVVHRCNGRSCKITWRCQVVSGQVVSERHFSTKSVMSKSPVSNVVRQLDTEKAQGPATFPSALKAIFNGTASCRCVNSKDSFLTNAKNSTNSSVATQYFTRFSSGKSLKMVHGLFFQKYEQDCSSVVVQVLQIPNLLVIVNDLFRWYKMIKFMRFLF